MRDFYLSERLAKNMADMTTGKLTSLKTVYSFFGPPGAGKGTVAREAVRRFGYQMVSTGEMLRAEVASGSLLGQSIRDIVARGGLVSDEIVTKLVFSILQYATVEVLILDGFPRTQRQADVFLNELPHSFPSVQFKVVYFDLAQSEIRSRIAARLTCERKSCQATYSLALHKSKIDGLCDWCGGILARRQDDSDSVLSDRLDEYEQHAQGLIDFYKRTQVDVCRLDPFNKSEEAVFQQFATQCAM
jgi:adenylate kinase